jgi:hypothetical protein
MATHSAGAGARQLDADFDDDPDNQTNTNGPFGESTQGGSSPVTTYST